MHPKVVEQRAFRGPEDITPQLTKWCSVAASFNAMFNCKLFGDGFCWRQYPSSPNDDYAPVDPIILFDGSIHYAGLCVLTRDARGLPKILVARTRQRQTWTIPIQAVGPRSGYNEMMTALQANIDAFGLSTDVHILDTHVDDLFTEVGAQHPHTRTKFFVAWSSPFPNTLVPTLGNLAAEFSNLAWMNIHEVLAEDWSNNQYRLVAADTLANAVNLRTEFMLRFHMGELAGARGVPRCIGYCKGIRLPMTENQHVVYLEGTATQHAWPHVPRSTVPSSAASLPFRRCSIPCPMASLMISMLEDGLLEPRMVFSRIRLAVYPMDFSSFTITIVTVASSCAPSVCAQ